MLAYRNNNNENTIELGLRWLMNEVNNNGQHVCFHNGICFDIPAITKVYPWFNLPEDRVFDTLVFSRLKYSDIFLQLDNRLLKKKSIEKKYAGRHSLESWGARMGTLKGTYTGDSQITDEKTRKASKWESWNPDMEAYGIQDSVVLKELYNRLKPWEYAQEAVTLEHQVQWIIARQERRGFAFDMEAAGALYSELVGLRENLRATLEETVPGRWWLDGPQMIPKRPNKTLGYIKGAAIQKIRWEPFNPTSRRHIIRFFKDRYDWKPTEFTDGGDPKVTDETLSALSFPEAASIAELMTIEKRISQLAEGPAAYMRKVKEDGRIHGRVTVNGAVTGRMTHSGPNMNVPKVGSLYGFEMRSLFIAKEPYVLVGGDASGLELRTLAHYMAFYDGGAYAIAVVNGSSKDGTDAHSLNTVAIGMIPTKLYTINGKQVKGRDCAKTFIYGFLYGAGDAKVGSIVGKGASSGRKLKNTFLRKTPALKRLAERVRAKVKEKKQLRGLDGRLLPIRHAHAALNTLLQSAGAITMKKALVICDGLLQSKGYVPGVDYEFVANVHDEFQIEATTEIMEDVGKTITEAIRLAGEYFKLHCVLSGDWKVGPNWAATH